jgi:D-amino-acid dehydrogenase
VVDDRRPGRATAAGAGIIAPWATALTGDVYRLYAAGAEAYPPLLDALHETGIDDIGYARNGTLVVTADTAAADAALELLAGRTADSAVAGRPEFVDDAETRRLFPPLADGFVGVHVPGGARVDGRRLVSCLLDGVRHFGGTVLDGTATFDRRHVHVHGARLEADSIVIAAGVWVDSLLGGATIPVVPQRGQICHLLLPGTDTGHWPSVLPRSDHYIVPFGDGRVVVGATREPDIDDVRVTAGGVSRVLAQALDLAPGLGDATLTETRVGLRPYPTVDHHPTIGRFDANTWVISGFGAIGLTIGPLVGERMATTLLGGPDDELLAPFSPK